MTDPVKTMCAMHTLAESLPHHRPRITDLIIHGHHVYRVTVERLPEEEALTAFNQLIHEEKQWTS